MNEDTLRKTATLFIFADLALLVFMFNLVIQAFFSQSYPETAFLIGVSFVLASQLVYFYERAFTSAEIWWTKDGFFTRMIRGNRDLEDEDASQGET